MLNQKRWKGKKKKNVMWNNESLQIFEKENKYLLPHCVKTPLPKPQGQFFNAKFVQTYICCNYVVLVAEVSYEEFLIFKLQTFFKLQKL